MVRRCTLIVLVAMSRAELVSAGEVGSARSEVGPGAATATLTQSIDRHIDARLKSAGIPKSPQATDEEFVRRAYLDLHGVVPTVDQTSSFLSDRSPDKRAKLIDQLLAAPRFAAHLADMWDDYLISSADDVRSQKQRLKEWLETAFQDKSWDQITLELLTASGHRDKDPAVAYLLKGRETLSPAELTDLVSQYFLGIRLNCAQCHDHPFAAWKQSDYWGMAAFFTQIQYTDRRQLKSGLIRDDPALPVEKLADAAKLRTLKFLAGDEWTPNGRPYRVAFAQWLLAKDNPYFARAAANRVWAQLFGRGVIEPVDDMHEGNPATHPELLAELSEFFIASGFDLRALYRAVCNTSAYQRTSMPTADNEQDAALLSHMRIKLLTPEQLYDSLSIVLPPVVNSKRAQRGNDPREEFVGFFRSEGDSDPTAYDRGIPQTLRMMNSDQWWSPRQEVAALRRIVGTDAADAEAIDRLYLRALARAPTDDERRILDEFLAKHPGEREQAYSEILWGLLNGSEFSLNH